MGPQAAPEPKTANFAVERGSGDQIDVDMVGPIPLTTSVAIPASSVQGESQESRSQSRTAPSPSPVTPYPSQTLPSPALSAVDGVPQTPIQNLPRAPTPSTSGSNVNNNPPQTGPVFALSYRMLFAVATMDTITIYDTQQASPIALLTKLHYDEFTDMAWYVALFSTPQFYCNGAN